MIRMIVSINCDLIINFLLVKYQTERLLFLSAVVTPM